MLGLDSIQQTSHHLEDSLKLLQQCPGLQVDQKLESLFLRVFDTLQELVEQLSNPFSLREDVVNNLMSQVDPVFEVLHQHLGLLVKQAGGSMQPDIRRVSVANGTEPEFPDLFDDLFDTTEKIEESHYLVEASTFQNTTEDADFSNFWQEEALEVVPTVEVDADNIEEFDQLEALLDLDMLVEPAELEVVPTVEVEADHINEFDQLEALLDLDMFVESAELEVVPTAEVEADHINEFDQLEALLDLDMFVESAELEVVPTAEVEADHINEFDQLEALLDLDMFVESAGREAADLDNLEDFGELEALLGEEEPDAATSLSLDTPAVVPVHSSAASSLTVPDLSVAVAKTEVVANPRRAVFEQTMRVPVKHLDNVSNLVGELVVYRNSLEQDLLRQRQFLDNLLHQVQQLSNVGARMQELYERSLLEASLQKSRQGSGSNFPLYEAASVAVSSERHATGMEFDALEMDRFTGFHTLSQEMIELIVRVRESSSDIEFITDETELVARQFRQVTTQLQEGLTRSRMVPLASIADRLPRAVRDIALKYGKQAELQIEGRDTLIDKVILEQLYDPMTHLVNNAITHGIETPEERLALSKSPVGQITIRAFHQGNQTVISVADDGAGIDSERVKEKAIEKGLITPDAVKTMSRLDVYDLLFHPGFSTKDQADEFAGRGVGMDVVRTSLNEIRGMINTDSTQGKGTTFTIRLPLTLSICKALCCLSDKTRIAFPMDGVEDTMDVPASSVLIEPVGQSCIPWRDSFLPLRPLKELLTYNRQLSRGNFYGGNREDDMISIVVLRSAGTFIAIQVDQVLGEQEIVIKQFEGPAPKPVGVAGATVLGDGRIMPIADVMELIDLAMGRARREGGAMLWDHCAAPVLPQTPGSLKTEPTVLIVDDSITVRELLSLTFSKAGYRVEQARDGQEAWDKLRDGLPCDIVFCDIEMPRMDGLELLSRIQKDPNLSQLPIAMLTSRGADRHRQMAAQLGASGYFTKPYLEEALLDAAQRMIKGEVLVTTQ